MKNDLLTMGFKVDHFLGFARLGDKSVLASEKLEHVANSKRKSLLCGSYLHFLFNQTLKATLGYIHVHKLSGCIQKKLIIFKISLKNNLDIR